MGIYCYTLRKNPIKAIDVDNNVPIEIGTFMYAYKESFHSTPEYNRRVARAHSFAEKARDANPNLVMVVVGDPNSYDLENSFMEVYRCNPTLEYFMDSFSPGDKIGRLYKNGRKFIFKRD